VKSMTVWARFKDKLAAFIDELRKSWLSFGKLIGDYVVAPFLDFIANLFMGIARSSADQALRMMALMGVPKKEIEMIRSTMPKGKGFAAGYALKTWTDMVSDTLSLSVMSGIQRRLQIFSNQRFTPETPEPAALINDVWKGVLSWDMYYKLMRNHGFAPGMSNLYAWAATSPLEPGAIIQAYLRGKLSRNAAKKKLMERGIKSDDADIMLELAWIIPSPTDLITMAVREAFTPAIAQKFGQYEDFPPEFAKWAKKQGLSEEWAKRYWASHWRLPSVELGYEMFHRNVINEKELKMLMRAQDIMPWWRDRLIQISYNPYTRVDIRRMYALGVLNLKQVYRAYRDLGYDHEKATNLTLFTHMMTMEKERDLTKSDILKGYEEKRLTREKAKELLQNLGYDEFEAEFYLTRTEQKREEKHKNEVIRAVRIRFERGVIDENEVVERLSAVNIPSSEIHEYIELWRKTRGRQVYRPNPAKLEQLLKAGVITTKEFKEEMIKHGASEKYIDWLIRLNIGGGES